MKKILILGIILFMIITSVKADNFVIPNDAIRLRVIPNSNSEYDQNIKMKVKNLLEYRMYNLLKNTKGVKKAREIIKSNISDIKKDINELLINENYDKSFTLNYGKNYFPSKEYRGVIYEDGYYESLVVTLGKGEGDNWWCVLFPPLCLLEAQPNEEVEYKFFIEELFDKFF